MRTMNKYTGMVQFVLAICVIGASTRFILSTQAASAYYVTLSTSNFTLQTVSVSADNLSNPGRVTFHLQNGSPFWYSIGVQSTPTGIALTPASANDPVTTTFLSSTPLLPPVGVLPFDQSNGAFASETLHMALAFSGPGQQVQLTLNPFDIHATTLDALALLLQLLGQKNGLSQIGLLAPNGLQMLFNAVSTMKDFNSLTNDYMQLLQNASNIPTNTTTGNTNTGASLAQAYACAKDIVALLTDQSEQLLLGSVLWNATGKAIPRPTLLNTIASFSNAQFSLGIEGFLTDEAQAMGTSLFQAGSPTVLIQTLTPSETTSPGATGSVSPVSSVSAVPPTPDPTIHATGTP